MDWDVGGQTEAAPSALLIDAPSNSDSPPEPAHIHWCKSGVTLIKPMEARWCKMGEIRMRLCLEFFQSRGIGPSSLLIFTGFILV